MLALSHINAILDAGGCSIVKLMAIGSGGVLVVTSTDIGMTDVGVDNSRGWTMRQWAKQTHARIFVEPAALADVEPALRALAWHSGAPWLLRAGYPPLPPGADPFDPALGLSACLGWAYDVTAHGGDRTGHLVPEAAKRGLWSWTLKPAFGRPAPVVADWRRHDATLDETGRRNAPCPPQRTWSPSEPPRTTCRQVLKLGKPKERRRSRPAAPARALPAGLERLAIAHQIADNLGWSAWTSPDLRVIRVYKPRGDGYINIDHAGYVSIRSLYGASLDAARRAVSRVMS